MNWLSIFLVLVPLMAIAIGGYFAGRNLLKDLMSWVISKFLPDFLVAIKELLKPPSEEQMKKDQQDIREGDMPERPWTRKRDR